MASAFAVTEFDYVTEDSNHHLIILLLLINLFCNKLYEPSLLGIELYYIEYPVIYNFCIKRTAYVIRHTKRISTAYIVIRIIRGYHNYGYILNPVIPVHIYKHFKAVFFRHYHINQNQCYIILIPAEHLYTLHLLMPEEFCICPQVCQQAALC